MGTTESASLIYPFRKNATGPVARAETWKFQEEEYPSSPLSSCSMPKTHSFAMLDIDRGTFPRDFGEMGKTRHFTSYCQVGVQILGLC